MPNDLTPLVEHVFQTLPSDVDRRHRLIAALDIVVPVGHPLKGDVQNIRFGLDHHISQLRELTLAAADRASAAVQIGGGR